MKIFRLKVWRQQKWHEVKNIRSKDYMIFLKAAAKNESFLFASIYFSEFITLGIGFLLTLKTSFTIAQLLSIWTLGINTILYQCLMIPKVFLHGVNIKSSWKRISEKWLNGLNYKYTDSDLCIGKDEKIIRMHGIISFRYPEQAYWVFRNLNIEILTSNINWIVGSNGSGKSTLIKCIMREEIPQEGRIIYEDAQGKEMESAQFSLVTEENFFFTTDLRNNLLLGNSVSDKVLLQYLMESGLLEEWEVKEDVLDKILFKDLQCSEGQLRRLSIIRALIARVDFIVLDEPFSDLDLNSQILMMKMIRNALRNCGIIIISHTYDHIESQDQVIQLEAGYVK